MINSKPPESTENFVLLPRIIRIRCQCVCTRRADKFIRLLCNLRSGQLIGYNKCLRRIVDVHWLDKIANRELWGQSNQKPVLTQLKRRKWKWLIGHTLRRNDDCVVKQALQWTPHGHRRRTKNTWKKEIWRTKWSQQV